MVTFEDDIEPLKKSKKQKMSKRRKSQFKNRIVGKEENLMEEWEDEFDDTGFLNMPSSFNRALKSKKHTSKKFRESDDEAYFSP